MWELVLANLPTLLGGGSIGAIVVPLVLKVLSFLANKITKGTLEIDDQQRAVIELALQNAIGFAIAKRNQRDSTVPAAAPLTGDDLAAAKDYLEAQIPDTLAHFRIGTRDLGDLVQSRFGKLLLDRLLPSKS